MKRATVWQASGVQAVLYRRLGALLHVGGVNFYHNRVAELSKHTPKKEKKRKKS